MRIFVVFLALLLAPVAGFATAGQRLDIHTASGPVSFAIELASTPEKRERGLMYRRELAADAGMLFDFARNAPVSMWMKNTPIPLDMLFIRADGYIANIAERTIPESLTPIDSLGPVLAVLELNGGTCARLGIRAGDKVVHPLFDAVK